jgi:hypothetical protein
MVDEQLARRSHRQKQIADAERAEKALELAASRAVRDEQKATEREARAAKALELAASRAVRDEQKATEREARAAKARETKEARAVRARELAEARAAEAVVGPSRTTRARGRAAATPVQALAPVMATIATGNARTTGGSWQAGWFDSNEPSEALPFDDLGPDSLL